MNWLTNGHEAMFRIQPLLAKKYHFKDEWHGDHFVSESAAKCVPMAGG